MNVLSDILMFILAVLFCECIYPGKLLTFEQGILAVALIAAGEIIRYELIKKIRR